MICRPPIPTLFPYTMLFRSLSAAGLVSAAPGVIGGRIELRSRQARRNLLDGLEHYVRVKERSEEHTSELQSHHDLVCRLLLEKKKHRRTELVGVQRQKT